MHKFSNKYGSLFNHRAECETKKTNEKEEEIKTVEAEILKIKSDIYNLKDVFTQYSMYGKFLAAVSPEDWRKERVIDWLGCFVISLKNFP